MRRVPQEEADLARSKWGEKEDGRKHSVCKARGGFGAVLLTEGPGALRLLGKETKDDFPPWLPFQPDTTDD